MALIILFAFVWCLTDRYRGWMDVCVHANASKMKSSLEGRCFCETQMLELTGTVIWVGSSLKQKWVMRPVRQRWLLVGITSSCSQKA